jgi:hypothetical protein
MPKKENLKEIKLGYFFDEKSKRSIDNVSEVVTGLIDARDSILRDYGKFVDCNIRISVSHPKLNVHIKEKHPISMGPVINKYLSVGGHWSLMIKSNYGLDDIEEALPADKKLLFKGILGKIFESYVVDRS